MNSHNPKTGFGAHKIPAHSEGDEQDAKLVTTTLANDEWSIADNSDEWCDPYNSTGKHVVLKARLLRREE